MRMVTRRMVREEGGEGVKMVGMVRSEMVRE